MSESQMRSPNGLLGTVLVVGGCGFLGDHLVRQLLQDPDCNDVYVVDRLTCRMTPQNRVVYLQGDVSDAEFMCAVMQAVQPRVVFHVASPAASLGKPSEFFATNVHGTQFLLAAAARNDSTKAFVFTSSVGVYANPPHVDISETHPLWPPSDHTNEYSRTKSIADSMVLSANTQRLRTVTLRVAHMYGEKQVQGLKEPLDQCSGDKMLFQIGDGRNLMDVLSVTQAAVAHVLAAKALLDSGRAVGKIDGEAFNISDGIPVPFWHHMKVIWTAARGRDISGDVRIIPAWAMSVFVHVLEWFLWIATLGTVKPPMSLRKTSLDYCIHSHTYLVDKARERLLFRPVGYHDADLVNATRVALDEQRDGQARRSGDCRT